MKYRSGLEEKVAKILGRSWKYEPEGIDYVVEHTYIPDFIARVDVGAGEPLNMVIEVTGVHDIGKEAKVDTMRSLWIPGVNATGQYGTWEYIEIQDPWDAQNSIRRAIKQIQLTAQ